MLKVAGETAECWLPCCRFHFIFADEKKTFIVFYTNESYTCAIAAVFPKPLLLLIIFVNRYMYVQAEEKGMKLDVRPNNKSEAVVLCITQLRTDLIKVSRR